MHVIVDQDDVVDPESAVHVAVPDPLNPSSQVTGSVLSVTPEFDPDWSLLATVRAPHEEAAIHHQHQICTHTDHTNHQHTQYTN